MSEKMEKSQPQISHLIGEKPKKNIGNKIARQIEEAFNKPKDWLDHSHPELWDKKITNIKEDTAQETDGLTDEAIMFAHAFQDLPAEQRAVLEQTAKAFMDSTKKQIEKVA